MTVALSRGSAAVVLLLFLAHLLPGASAQESRRRAEPAGTKLLFGVDFQAAIETGELAPKEDRASVLEKVMRVMRQRLEVSGARGARVEAQGTDRILVELPTTEAAAVDALVHRLTYLGRLEMRMLATGDYDREGVRFELAAEHARLWKWLGREENRSRIMADPCAIAAFNQNAGSGKEDGPSSPHLHWLPAHAVRQKRRDAQGIEQDVWVYRVLGGRPGSPSTLCFTPEGTEAKDTSPRFLAINRHEVAFTNKDLVRDAILITKDMTGSPAIAYEIVPERAAEYADLSASHVGGQMAIIVNGIVHSAPMFMSRIEGRGQITLGTADAGEPEVLVDCLKTEGFPIRPELLARRTLPPK
jgi:preprotein translocase subunit SecD